MFVQSEATTTWRKTLRRRRRWIILAVALVPTIWLGRFVYLHLTLRPTPRREYWEAKAAALDPTPPTAVSSATIRTLLMKAPWDSYPPAAPFSDSYLTSDLLDGPWSNSRPDLATAIAVDDSGLFSAWWSEISKALATGWDDAPTLNPVGIAGLPASQRHIVHWFLFRARREWEARHEASSAAADWLDALRVARQTRRGQTTVYLLCESSAILATAREMMLAARAGARLEDKRALPYSVNEILGSPLGPAELTEGTRLQAMYMLDLMFVREGGQWLDVPQASYFYADMLGHTWGGSAPVKISPVWNLASWLFRSYSDEVALIERSCAEMSKCVDLRACRAVLAHTESDPASKLGALDGFPGHAGGWSWTSSCVSVIELHYEARCSLDAALAMLAMNRYRKQYQHYPDSLADLVPEYLDHEPLDYADRRPLRYRRAGDGYVLYSIGSDGMDNGGKTAGDSKRLGSMFDVPDADVVFSSIEREPKR